jgi:hypothetical protein
MNLGAPLPAGLPARRPARLLDVRAQRPEVRRLDQEQGQRGEWGESRSFVTAPSDLWGWVDVVGSEVHGAMIPAEVCFSAVDPLGFIGNSSILAMMKPECEQ